MGSPNMRYKLSVCGFVMIMLGTLQPGVLRRRISYISVGKFLITGFVFGYHVVALTFEK